MSLCAEGGGRVWGGVQVRVRCGRNSFCFSLEMETNKCVYTFVCVCDAKRRGQDYCVRCCVCMSLLCVGVRHGWQPKFFLQDHPPPPPPLCGGRNIGQRRSGGGGGHTDADVSEDAPHKNHIFFLRLQGESKRKRKKVGT